MSTRRLLASLAATLLVLAGCSSDGGDEAVRTVDETTTTAPSELTPTELVRAAAAAPAEYETVSMEMVTEVDGEPFMRTSGTGSYDGSRGDTTVEMDGMEFRMLVVDGNYYYQYPAMPPGYEWVSMSGAEMTDASGIDPTAMSGDPTDMLAVLETVSDDLEPLGTEELFGTTVQGFRAKVSRDAVLRSNAASGVFEEGFAAQAADLLPETFAVDVWIDGDGLPRRQSWSMDMPVGPGGEVATFDYRIDFAEWGAPLDVAAPNPASVMTMTEFLASMGG